MLTSWTAEGAETRGSDVTHPGPCGDAPECWNSSLQWWELPAGEGAAPVTGPGHALGGGVVGALLFLSSMSKEPWKEVARNPGGLILEGLSSHSGAWW